jgi:hypothetical protein
MGLPRRVFFSYLGCRANFVTHRLRPTTLPDFDICSNGPGATLKSPDAPRWIVTALRPGVGYGIFTLPKKNQKGPKSVSHKATLSVFGRLEGVVVVNDSEGGQPMFQAWLGGGNELLSAEKRKAVQQDWHAWAPLLLIQVPTGAVGSGGHQGWRVGAAVCSRKVEPSGVSTSVANRGGSHERSRIA